MTSETTPRPDDAGPPPRIPPLGPDEFTDEVRATTAAMRAAAGLPPSDDIPEIMATTLRHPALFAKHGDLALALMRDGLLSHRDRELAVLRVAWLCRCGFEWGEHVAIGRRAAGLTPEETERVTIGSTAPGWNDDDRAIIRAVEEMHADATISDATWAALAARLDERQLLELPILVGQYLGVAFMLNAVGIRRLAGNEGITAR